MKYNPKPFERRLKLYLARQEQAIEELINISIKELVRRTTLVGAPSDRDFFFRDYPALSKMVDNVLGRLSGELTGMVQTGIEWSWELANAKNDDMVSRILRSIGVGRVPAEALARWNQKNLPALEAFERRRIGGMGLSDKVWAYTKGIKGDLELALDLGIGEGMNAGRLSRAVRQYLKEPYRLYRRVRDEKGILRLSKSASNYHPGQGMYRSSYKNAKRLATTETNMAYRSADCERARQIDFILGIEIHLSKNHTCLDAHGVPQPFYDICDELQGRYPKDFIFKGWHPNCRCYMTTILPDQDEFVKYLAAMDENGHSTYPLGEGVTELPENFKKWMSENQNRIALAEQRGQLPYFITDNRELIERDVYLNPRDRYAPMTAKDLQYLASQGIISEGSIGVLGSMKSDMLRQAEISRLVTTHAGFDIDTYVRIYGAKNPKVTELYQEIGILRGKDEVLRLRKINELKTICGNLSAKEIQKWGLASGLEYVGVDKNVVFEKAGSRFVNGKVIDIKELRKDLLMFRAAGSNVVFNYPLGMRKADAVYDLGEAAKFVGGLPAYLTSGISSIRFINQRNPFDKYWAAYYKLRSFESYATDGKHITFWRQTKTKPAFFQYALTHEMAHIYDFAHDITKSDKWKQAIEADIALFKDNKIASDFPTPYARQAYRAADNIREDFAESLAKKLEYDKKYGSKWFSRLFPNRAKLLAELLAKWPK